MGIPFKQQDIYKDDEGTYLIHFIAWELIKDTHPNQ
jgi:hypothetical protein